MVPSKQADVVGTSGTEHSKHDSVSGRRRSARGPGTDGAPAEEAAQRAPKRAGGAEEQPKTKKKKTKACTVLMGRGQAGARMGGCPPSLPWP